MKMRYRSLQIKLIVAVLVFAYNVSLIAQHKKATDLVHSYLPSFNDTSIVRIFGYDGLKVNTITNNSITQKKYLDFLDPKLSFGSGVMISKDGIILTAKHVVADSNDNTFKFLSVKIPGNPIPFPAEEIYKDENSDFAFIKILSLGNQFSFQPLPESNEELHIGQTVFAYGYPMVPGEVDPNITKGIITRKSSVFSNYWQFDANVSPGSSGGVIVGDNGQICGLVVAKISNTSGLNYALPITKIMNTYRTIVKMPALYDNMEISRAKQIIARYISDDEVQLEGYMGDKKFENINNEFNTKIQNPDQIPKQLAIFQELKASYYFNKAAVILYLSGKSSCSELTDIDREKYKYYINLSLKLLTTADSLTARTDRGLGINTLMVMLYSTLCQSDTLSDDDILSMVQDIGINSDNFEKKWGKYSQKIDNEMGGYDLEYTNVTVRCNSNSKVEGIWFYYSKLPKENLYSLNNISVYDNKSQIIETLGSNYISNRQGEYELLTWQYNSNLNIIFQFTNSGYVTWVGLQKRNQ